MNAVPATPAAIAELTRAKSAIEIEIRTMRRANHAFRRRRRKFMRRIFADDDFRRFTDTMKRNLEYCPVPFSPRLLLAKMVQIERLERQIAIGKQLVTTARAS